ncbi:CBS domain-containing protein [Pseudoroseomonas wenyumeiae]
MQQAAEMMGRLDVGALPVGDAEDVQGVVTDRDLLYASSPPAGTRRRCGCGR